MKLLVLVALAACGKDHMTSESMAREPDPAAPVVVGETTPKLDAGCAAYAKAQCATLAKCSPNSSALHWVAGGCEPALLRECTLEFAVPGSGVTDAVLNRCATWSALQCPLDRAAGDCEAPPGQRADGAACTSGIQCKATYCKRAKYTDACGVCAAPPPGRVKPARGPLLGAACDGRCGDSLYCDKGKCIAPKARVAGESCTRDFLGFPDGPQPCGPNLSCVGEAKQICEQRPADGEACKKDGARCLFPSTCRDGACKPPDFAACKP